MPNGVLFLGVCTHLDAELPSKPDVKVTYQRLEEDWDNVLQTNLRGAGMVIKAAVKRMIPAGRGGSIVNTASISGIERGVRMGDGIYAASKAGLIQLSKVTPPFQHMFLWPRCMLMARARVAHIK